MDEGFLLSVGTKTPLLASHVRNAREASLLVDLDCLEARQSLLLNHLMACCAHDRHLRLVESALTVYGSGEAQLRAASALICTALATIRRDVAALLAEMDSLLKHVTECHYLLQGYSASNEVLAIELAEEGAAPGIAAAKQRLWLIEESLVTRIESVLGPLQRQLALIHSQYGVG